MSYTANACKHNVLTPGLYLTKPQAGRICYHHPSVYYSNGGCTACLHLENRPCRHGCSFDQFQQYFRISTPCTSSSVIFRITYIFTVRSLLLYLFSSKNIVYCRTVWMLGVQGKRPKSWMMRLLCTINRRSGAGPQITPAVAHKSFVVTIPSYTRPSASTSVCCQARMMENYQSGAISPTRQS